MAGAGDTVEILPVEEAVTRDGLAKLEEGIRDIITELRHHQSSDFASLRDEITSRDVLLRKLEESVTRLSEDIAPLKDYVTAKMQEEAHSAARSQSSGSPEGGANQDGDQETEEERNNRAQNRCVDVMMSLTEIRENNVEKTLKVRGFYEKIYEASPFTSLMLKFLERNRGVKVLIDCDSFSINNLVKRLVNLDGEKQNGTEFLTFADIFECRVYLVGVSGVINVNIRGHCKKENFDPEVSLAQSLAQIVMYLIFKNRGCPYVCDDEMYEKLYEKIVLETSQKKDSVTMDGCVYHAFRMKSSLAREVSLISVVPGMLVKYGSNEGMSKLLEQMPFLTFFFIHHVIPKMRS
ncbi:uncharacterized protein LOC124170153 isoform X2 [Ischnura elegans]|nr:uncharacterized protein LOC124170153 isoform X2 [Ischnura elegans]XP_046404807.1 uncharacterized protein LOC124170153 isoform X2 [Ischnura elegans]XP_046404808.1 uncharacterized protein LOC124170153 isoform X2 [Ischnura elegans]